MESRNYFRKLYERAQGGRRASFQPMAQMILSNLYLQEILPIISRLRIIHKTRSSFISTIVMLIIYPVLAGYLSKIQTLTIPSALRLKLIALLPSAPTIPGRPGTTMLTIPGGGPMTQLTRYPPSAAGDREWILEPHPSPILSPRAT